MHELAITECIVDAVCQRVGASKVTRVCVVIGRLSGVVPDTVRFCFDVCATGTGLEGAQLDVEEVPARIRCHDCHEITELDDAIPLCPCGSVHLEILSGQELLIKEVEVI